MNRWPRAIVLATVVPLAFGALAAYAQTRFEAEVRRTSFGIVHVKAADYAGIGYGVGYAFAQDNVCMIADEFLTVRGERARFLGATGTTSYGVNNLNADFFYTLINGDPAPLKAGLDGMRPEVQAAFRGWVAGYNRYLRDTPAASLPAPCTSAPWVRPIDEIDLMRLVRRYAVQASSGSFIDGMVAAKPPAASVAGDDLLALDESHWRHWRDGYGSNALAIGADGTDNGRGLLLGNPHFPWTGTLRFYQFHITIPGEIDVMGGSLSGFPLINIGFNQDVAWSHTVDTVWHFTLHQLKLDPANPLRYVYDGQPRDLTAKTVTIQVRNADGSLSPRSNTFYLSHFGPIVTSTALPIPWTKTNAYALRDANLDNWRLGDTWLDVNRAKSTGDVLAAIQRWVGIPWVNTVAADRDGNALYAVVSTAPNVPRETLSSCIPNVTFAVVLASKGPPVLDGSRSECEWVEVAGAPQKGLVPGDQMPYLFRRDFVQNSNDSYWLANPAVDLYRWDFSPIIGVVPDVQGLRTRLGIIQAQARLAGTDGLPGNKFTMQNLQQIALSNRALAADLFLPDTLALCQTPAAQQAVAAECAVLAAWDGKFELSSIGAQLFREYFQRARTIPNVYAVPFDYLNPVTTPRGFRVTDPATGTALVAALKAGGDAMRTAGVPIGAPLGQMQFTLRGTRPIPIHGGPGSGASDVGVYNAIGTTLVPNLGYVVTTGTSYIQTVQFTDSGVNAQAFLSYSQSTDPASPWFADQTLRFSAKQWITLPYTEAAITSDPNYKTTTIRE
jgi:acyl-homoserine-lactone acylase